MLVSNGLGYRTDGSFVYVYPVEELAKLENAKRKLVSRVIRLAYLNAASAKGSDRADAKLSWQSCGHSAGQERDWAARKGIKRHRGRFAGDQRFTAGHGLRRELKEIEKVIAEIDVMPTQVLIEATILRATLNEDNALGIDFTTVGGIDFAAVNSVSPAAQSVTTGIIPQGQLDNTNFTVRTDLNSSLPPGGFTFGIIKDQVGVFVRVEQLLYRDSGEPEVLA
jgi:type II secretory pathway component GspD/PulD (secretin)